jgi:hypothetical protein
MAKVKQSRVRSGFDVEVLLGERYLQMVLATALDAGTIPSEAVFSDTTILVCMIHQPDRMYEPTLDADGNVRVDDADAFQTEILFGHPLGANLKVRAKIGEKGPFFIAIDFDLFAKLDLVKTFDEEGALSEVGMAVSIVDVDSPLMPQILARAFPDETDPVAAKALLLAKVKETVDRTISMGGASKFKRVEDLDIKWHEPVDDDHPACLGLYINVRMRNGDPEEDFLPPRGGVAQARNFLPKDQDMAMASRPGMYADMAKHIFSSTAVETSFGNFEHAWRKSLLNPDSERLGDLNEAHVGLIPPLPGETFPPNGLRIRIEAEYIDPIDLTNTDVTMTVDLRPKTAADGSLEWDSDFDISLDTLFEFMGLWATMLMFILFGGAAALIFMGAVFLIELGIGIGISIWKEGSIQKKADATLADVIPDRLTISTRRWDPFYATLHQVVTKPAQAEFNAKGFMMCGKAFVGRQLVPPLDTFIRDELRDADGAVTGMRYFIADYEKVLEDSVLLAPGTHRRPFSPATADEPELWPLTLDEFKDRLEDPEGPLVLAKIPYFQAYVYIRGHQIDQVLCISGTEIESLQGQIRSQIRASAYEGIKAHDGAAITQEVIADLGPGATQEEIDAEVEKRIQKKLKRAMDKYHSPSPLRLARDGSMEPLLRFDLAPDELVMLQDRKVISLDDGQLKTIHGRRVADHSRDIAHHGPEEEDDDNLLARPRYKPSPDGPIFL